MIVWTVIKYKHVYLLTCKQFTSGTMCMSLQMLMFIVQYLDPHSCVRTCEPTI